VTECTLSPVTQCKSTYLHGYKTACYITVSDYISSICAKKENAKVIGLGNLNPFGIGLS